MNEHCQQQQRDEDGGVLSVLYVIPYLEYGVRLMIEA
jgi:hypothetical protein